MGWLRENIWLVPLLLIVSGVFMALGSLLAYRKTKSKWGLRLLLASALIQTLAGLVWYLQPSRWG